MINKEERKILQYRPTLKLIKEEINSPDYVQSSTTDKIDESINNMSSYTWKDIYTILERITSLASVIDSKYANNDIGKVGDITFLDYKNALGSMKYEDRELVYQYEKYQMDYKGHTDIEIYPILAELEEEWKYNQSFFKSTALRQISSVTGNIDIDSEEYNNLIDDEVGFIEDLYFKNTQRQELENQLKSNKTIDMDNYKALIRTINSLEDQITSRVELTEVMNSKIEATDKILYRLEYIVDMVGSDRTKDAVMNSLNFMQLDTALMTSMALSTKLSIDGQIKDILQIEDERKTIANSTISQQVNNDLIYASHINNTAIKPIARAICDMDDITDVESKMIDIVAEGIKRSNTIYSTALNSSYTLDMQDKDMLNQKISLIMRKHDTRAYFNAFSNVGAFIEKNLQYPNSEELDSIL